MLIISARFRRSVARIKVPATIRSAEVAEGVIQTLAEATIRFTAAIVVEGFISLPKVVLPAAHCCHAL